MKRFLLTTVVLLSAAARALAQDQPGESFSEIRNAVAPDDIVKITDSRGDSGQGKVVDLTATSVRVRIGKQTKEWQQADILQIQKRREDSVMDGTLIGLAAGLGSGVAIARGLCSHPDSECEAIAGAIFIPTGAGVGALVGALIDSGQHRFDTVFRARNTAARSFLWSPLFSNDRKGLAIAFRF